MLSPRRAIKPAVITQRRVHKACASSRGVARRKLNTYYRAKFNDQGRPLAKSSRGRDEKCAISNVLASHKGQLRSGRAYTRKSLSGLRSTDELTGRAVTPKLDGTFSDRVAERAARVAGRHARSENPLSLAAARLRKESSAVSPPRINALPGSSNAGFSDARIPSHRNEHPV